MIKTWWKGHIMDGQYDLFEYIPEDPGERIKDCKCGNHPEVIAAGVGTPSKYVPLKYSKYRYYVECQNCGMMSARSADGWLDLAPTEADAVKHWNMGWRIKNPYFHKK